MFYLVVSFLLAVPLITYMRSFSPLFKLYALHILSSLITPIILGEEYTLQNSSLSSFLQPPVTSSPSVQISSSAPCPCFSLSVRGQVSHPHRTTGKIIVLYILILIFLDSRWEDNGRWTEWQQALPEFHLLLISPESNFSSLLSQIFELWHISKGSVCYLMSWDSNTYWTSAFISGPTSLLVWEPQSLGDRRSVRLGAEARISVMVRARTFRTTLLY
jgi:hypothetical protein